MCIHEPFCSNLMISINILLDFYGLQIKASLKCCTPLNVYNCFLIQSAFVGCYSVASTCATTWRHKSPTAFILLLLLNELRLFEQKKWQIEVSDQK
ncbi:hypothetical protein BpHYR1_044084 [Brachionus plicatilis]|uniref:Uncharacterized protein n=1 Tax=Brachionus plicatilis TaxID=10195 RepID=A0A3M7QW91_BRAPC|nr:hypothetical protein BpHYR1_044084 [Brachionus plicatilis]